MEWGGGGERERKTSNSYLCQPTKVTECHNKDAASVAVRRIQWSLSQGQHKHRGYFQVDKDEAAGHGQGVPQFPASHGPSQKAGNGKRKGGGQRLLAKGKGEGEQAVCMFARQRMLHGDVTDTLLLLFLKLLTTTTVNHRRTTVHCIWVTVKRLEAEGQGEYGEPAEE